MGRAGRAGGGLSFFVSPLGIVFTTVLIDLIGFGIVLPILPLWAEDFGASPVQIGLITASYALMQIVFAPVWGRLSDTHGRRPIILLSLAGSAVASLLIGVAGTLLVLFLARVLQGVAGASYAAAQAYVADVTEAKDRAKGMGMIGAAFGIGFVLGPAIGAIFSGIDARLPFFVAAALAAGNFMLAYRRLPESLRPGSREAPVPRLALVRRALSSAEVAPLVWLSFVATFAFIGMESTFALFGERRFAYDTVQMGLLFVYIGAMAALSQGYLVGKVVDRWGEMRVMIGGLAGTAVGLLVVGLSHISGCCCSASPRWPSPRASCSPRRPRSSRWWPASATRAPCSDSTPRSRERGASPGPWWPPCSSSTPGSRCRCWSEPRCSRSARPAPSGWWGVRRSHPEEGVPRSTATSQPGRNAAREGTSDPLGRTSPGRKRVIASRPC